MEYIKIKWIHESKDFPIDLYSEIDSDRFEVRKVEVFPDGSLGYADAKDSSKDTKLGDVAMPPLDKLNSDPEFKASVISKDEFEEIWLKAK